MPTRPASSSPGYCRDDVLQRRHLVLEGRGGDVEPERALPGRAAARRAPAVGDDHREALVGQPLRLVEQPPRAEHLLGGPRRKGPSRRAAGRTAGRRRGAARPRSAAPARPRPEQRDAGREGRLGSEETVGDLLPVAEHAHGAAVVLERLRRDGEQRVAEHAALCTPGSAGQPVTRRSRGSREYTCRSARLGRSRRRWSASPACPATLRPAAPAASPAAVDDQAVGVRGVAASSSPPSARSAGSPGMSSSQAGSVSAWTSPRRARPGSTARISARP